MGGAITESDIFCSFEGPLDLLLGEQAFVADRIHYRSDGNDGTTERDAQSATADREIVVSRVISASRELVFEASTEVRHPLRWWGPEGFTTTTRAFEFRVAGAWDFVMHGADGTDYQ